MTRPVPCQPEPYTERRLPPRRRGYSPWFASYTSLSKFAIQHNSTSSLIFCLKLEKAEVPPATQRLSWPPAGVDRRGSALLLSLAKLWHSCRLFLAPSFFSKKRSALR